MSPGWYQQRDSRETELPLGTNDNGAPTPIGTNSQMGYLDFRPHPPGGNKEATPAGQYHMGTAKTGDCNEI